MSRIGRMPIPVDAKVKVTLADDMVTVQGPNGTLEQRVPSGIDVKFEDNTLSVHRRDDSKSQRALHGLARALLANAVQGVHEGFKKELEIHGVGYRAEVKGSDLKLALGFSHPVVFPIPEGIKIAVEKNKLTVSGANRQQVGQISADIRALRPPDVYKQKGIRYADERLRKKAGKAAAK